MHVLLSLVVAATLSKSTTLQVGGGSATFQQNRPSGYQAARQAELAKRATWKQEDGRYLEASVLTNVPADEYVATFSISMEGKTLAAARAAMDATVKGFTAGLSSLRLAERDSYVDFVTQNRIYGYEEAGNNVVREVVAGFEVKKNVAFRYRDKAALDRLIEAAAKAEVFDLVKVDYIVKDHGKIQATLMEEAAKVIKRRAIEIEKLFDQGSIRISSVMPPQFSVYYPSEMYDAYVAQESENIYGYRPNQVVQTARKPRTFYYHGLEGKDFDVVLGPPPLEPMVQFTVYVRAKY